MTNRIKRCILIGFILMVGVCGIPERIYGTTVFLSQAEIEEKWGGVEEKWESDKTKAYVQELIPKVLYEEWFPKRYGSQAWCKAKKIQTSPGEYYSYENFIEAVASVAELKYMKVYREGYPSCALYYRLHKPTKKQTLIYEDPSFNNKWNQDKPTRIEIVDLGSFLKGSNEQDNLRELCAFFAQVSHETEGMYYKEEIRYTNRPTNLYSQKGTGYEVVSGASYHGRGPLQLSWNYNYGLMSGLLFGDVNRLLEHPEQVSESGKIGYMSAIAYWMLPQGSKPSCHEVMQNKWEPTTKQKNLGMHTPCFGVTINIIHGNAESNKTVTTDTRVKSRVERYIGFAKSIDLDVSGEQKDTFGMRSFR